MSVLSAVVFLACSDQPSDEDDSDFFPTERQVRNRQLRLEREEFIKVCQIIHYAVSDP